MKQEIKIEKNLIREGVFNVTHTLPFTHPLVVRYDKETDTLHLWELKGGEAKIFPPVFSNTAICMACGKEKHVNTSGYCEDCWIQFSHLKRHEPQRWEYVI